MVPLCFNQDIPLLVTQQTAWARRGADTKPDSAEIQTQASKSLNTSKITRQKIGAPTSV